MSELIGKSIERYHILEQLGQGGMATVYKAYDTRLEADVAVKVIRTDMFPPAVLERVLQRFEREAKALARLTHPNIVGVIDYGEQDGMPYLVMKYLLGGTLKELTGKPIHFTKAAQILEPIARALTYAHKQGILHRDVKPSNILITESQEPVLTDFGIAKLLESEETQTLTGTGLGIGTPEYMAPEQGLGKEVDGRADIYALGVVLYELITGHKPYSADTPMAVIVKQIHDPLPGPRNFIPGLPDNVEKVLFKVLAKDPENRYQAMSDFSEVLNNLISQSDSEKKIFDQDNSKCKPELKPNYPYSTTETKTQDDFAIPETPAKSRKDKTKNNWLKWAAIGGIIFIFVSGTILISQKSKSQIVEKTSILQPSPEITELNSTQTKTFEQTATDYVLLPKQTLMPGSRMKNREKDSMIQIFVPASEFEMGSDASFLDENPKHTVYIDAFWIDQTEVTNSMYAKCVNSGKCTEPIDTSSSTETSQFNNANYENNPVININWYQANDYCEWVGGSLPSEAEWEKAARGIDGRIYPWGNSAPQTSYANYNNHNGNTSVVGKYPSGASPYGVLDMAGNVWEWVADWYDSDYYTNSPYRNPMGPLTGESKVIRGGSWYDSDLVGFLRSTRRNYFFPSDSSITRGFRCVTTE